MSVGQRLRQARKAANMTQVTLAQVSGVMQARITALETGVQEKSVFLPELALALGVDVSWLATGITQEERAIELTAVASGVVSFGRINVFVTFSVSLVLSIKNHPTLSVLFFHKTQDGLNPV